MAFTPTNANLDERAPWRNSYHNDLRTDLINFFGGGLDGTELEAPLVLSKSGQHIDGNDANYIHSFRRWFGQGSNVSVRDATAFDANVNGATDDTAAIQAAIDDLPSTGGVVVMPPGVWAIEGGIKWSGTNLDKDYVAIMGFGDATEIKITGSGTFDVFESGSRTGLMLANLRINGNKAALSGTNIGINATGSTDCTIFHCTIHDMEDNAIKVGGSTRLKIYGCSISTCAEDAITHGTADVATGLLISACHIFSNVKDGIDLSPMKSAQIAGCVIKDNTDSGIVLSASGRTNTERVGIAGCTLSGNGGSGDPGILISNTEEGNTISQITINGCFISESGDAGIKLVAQGSSPIRGCTITGNTMANNEVEGITVENNVKFCTISGNTIYNNSDASAGAAPGILLTGDEGGECERNVVLGNCVIDDRGGSVKHEYAIEIQANANHNVVVGNTLLGSSVAIFIDSGTGNDVGHNAGY